MIPVYRLRGPAQSSVMFPGQPKRPWGGFSSLLLAVLAVLVAWFIVRPIGLEVAGVFQRLTDAFRTGK
jgi:hypothetical protein